jgi:hypothetical protein
MSPDMAKKILARIFAFFLMTALGMIGTGTLVGINVWQAALMAGIAGVANVIEGLSRAYVNDGKLTMDEIDDVFNAAPVQNAGSRKK